MFFMPPTFLLPPLFFPLCSPISFHVFYQMSKQTKQLPLNPISPLIHSLQIEFNSYKSVFVIVCKEGFMDHPLHKMLMHKP